MADTVKSTSDSSKHGMIVVNPDGSNVGGAVSLAKDTIPISGVTEAVGVAIVDTDGNQIASFGGGTQYTEGDTDASITGTAVMWEDSSNTLRAVSVVKPLPIGAVSTQSTLGVNSSNEASNSSYSNWSTNTWTGTYEQNDYQYLVVSLHTDDDGGTLYFDFSPDGTNTNTFPVAGFTIVDGSHEIHAAVKSGRYFRARYVGTGGRTYFRLYTYYTNTRLQLNSPLNTSMTADSDGQIVKAAHVVQYYPSPSTVAEGDFDTPSITRHREVRTRDQRHVHFQECEDYTEFTTLGNDTANLANTTNHVYGTHAITFDKVNGAANTVFAGVSTTTLDAGSTNISEIFEEGGFVIISAFLPSITNVDYVFLRYGTDSSNYNEWRWDSADLTASTWLPLRKSTSTPDAYAGNGWDTSNVQYVSFGVAFNGETNTLAGIVFDNVGFIAGRVTDTTLDATISSSVTTPNINIHRVGGTPTDTNTGNASAGTQRVVLATNQSAIPVTQSGTWNITNVSGTVSLPTGASTSANQTSMLTELYILNGSMAMQVDDAGSGTIYQGWADPGTATSAASWRIRKIVSSGSPEDTAITWADSNRNFDNVWNNRTSLTYG